MHIDIQVSPGSGTDALAGIQGTLTIRIEGKQHFGTGLARSLTSQKGR
jgi:hypothetical protein